LIALLNHEEDSIHRWEPGILNLSQNSTLALDCLPTAYFSAKINLKFLLLLLSCLLKHAAEGWGPESSLA
jgi:hypothetical protein